MWPKLIIGGDGEFFVDLYVSLFKEMYIENQLKAK
jgi:hypothetical protein